MNWWTQVAVGGTIRAMPRATAPATVDDRLRAFVERSSEDVFLRSDFASYGGTSQVGRAIARLVAQGTLVRLGVGVLARAKPSTLSGKPIPVKPLDVLVPVVLAKLGVSAVPGRLARMYNEGRSTQVPPGLVFDVGGKQVRRRLGFGAQIAEFETTAKMRARR